jgi:hypothetical protein
LFFSQRADVLTNDPDHQTLVLIIKGEVREHFLAEPAELVFTNLGAGEVQTRSVTLFSHAWDQFEITRITASNPKFRWAVHPASAEALAEVKARCGYALQVTAPAENATGHFQESLSIYASPKGRPDETRRYDVLLAGERVGWLSIPHEGALGEEGIDLGIVQSGQGFQRRLTLRARKAKVESVETTPSFLRATATPGQSEGWYYLDLQIPRDAPVCTHLGQQRGELRFRSKDSALPVVKIPVAFAVKSDGFVGQ